MLVALYLLKIMKSFHNSRIKKLILFYTSIFLTVQLGINRFHPSDKEHQDV